MDRTPAYRTPLRFPPQLFSTLTAHTLAKEILALGSYNQVPNNVSSHSIWGDRGMDYDGSLTMCRQGKTAVSFGSVMHITHVPNDSLSSSIPCSLQFSIP